MQAPPTNPQRPFDIVLLDPPYDHDPVDVLSFASLLHSEGALAKGAVIVYEHDLKSSDAVEAAAKACNMERRAKKYGKTGVSILTFDEE